LNEDAVRLLNYFVSYKEVVSRIENKNELSNLDDLHADASDDHPEFTIKVLPKLEEFVIKQTPFWVIYLLASFPNLSF
jgi:hypothetical protein